MGPRKYQWEADDGVHEIVFLPVAGTGGRPFLFGQGPDRRAIEIRDFWMMSTPVTQAFWRHVMDANPAERDEPDHPVTNVSWDQVAGPGGFIERLNGSPILTAVAGSDPSLRMRLPSESEWEYAARGGPHWTDGFVFSGSNNIDEVAWYGPKFSRFRRFLCRVFGWRVGWRLGGRFPRGMQTHTHPVGAKAPNQLGIYDMCGNVWEWCQDKCVSDVNAVPQDGSAWLGEGVDRRLRGGCHHNWDIHCTVSFRYGIAPGAHDGCIGFRLVV